MRCSVVFKINDVYYDNNGNRLSPFELSGITDDNETDYNGSVLDGNDVLINSDFVFSDKDVLLCDANETIVSDNTIPNFGFVGQYATLKIKDSSMNFIPFLKKNKNANYSVYLYFNNAKYDQYYLIDKIDIIDEKNEVDISLVDRLEKLKQISYTTLPTNTYSAWDLFQHCLSIINSAGILNDTLYLQYNLSDESKLDNTMIFINNYIEYKTCYDFLIALCQVLHCCLYVSDSGLEVVFYE